MIIKISGKNVKHLVGSLNISDVIAERSVTSFDIITDKSTHYKKGQPVSVYDSFSNLVYAGVINKASEKRYSSYTSKLIHKIQCQDWTYLADKRIIAKAYENVSAGEIVRDIVANYLSYEGVVIGEIQDGPIVSQAIFNYVKTTVSLNTLSEKAGFWWNIDADKKLYFASRQTYSAPFELTWNKLLVGSVSVEHSNSKYRNKQYIKGGKDVTDPMTEYRHGDGQVRTWVVGFPVAKEPVVLINGIQIAYTDIGIRGVETAKKFYWSKGENTITQDESEVLLQSTDTIAITYQGEFDIVAISANQTEIQNTIDLEGTGTGVVEEVDDEKEITSKDAAFESANAKLSKYALEGVKLKFRTSLSGLKPGHLLSVTLAEHEMIDKEMLVESISVSDDAEKNIWYDVLCSSGPEQGSWVKLFQAMANSGNAFVIRENISESQILITLQAYTKTWLQTDPSNIFKTVFPSTTQYPSATIYPMFAYADRVKYIELLDSSNAVLVRKRVTKQVGADTNRINSVTYITPDEGNGTIAKVRFYGGSQATEIASSGVLIDEQILVRTKSNLEAIQLDKTDIKGW